MSGIPSERLITRMEKLLRCVQPKFHFIDPGIAQGIIIMYMLYMCWGSSFNHRFISPQLEAHVVVMEEVSSKHERVFWSEDSMDPT